MWRFLGKWLYRILHDTYEKFLEIEKRKQFDRAKKQGLVTVGKYTYGTPTIISFPGDINKVSIGSYCSIADGVTILVGGNHRVDWITTFPIRLMFELVKEPDEGVVASKGDVIIGSDVWIGNGATILSGVEIGSGAVIGARAVVTKSVPPYAIVVGNPGKVVKKRFSESQIKRLLEICWWEWPPEVIAANVGMLCSGDVEKFCSLYCPDVDRENGTPPE
ncbi:CatB-related O-acetyltransferase [Pelotomaculum isophthalicicum]|uniref:CatB-related O-acetyltransferase n=1 Tax=Pelotomaculum isophthalicicum TaxID=342448 RepID=UPI00240662CB|nr:CatB-related O-acetyltransferase [Pelotomaculum isophthalicicum]